MVNQRMRSQLLAVPEGGESPYYERPLNNEDRRRAAKTAKIELTSPVIFLSLSTMNEAERAVNASKESKLHVGLGPQSGHTRKETRDSDLKLTRLRTPPTTTNTTPKSRGVILR